MRRTPAEAAARRRFGLAVLAMAALVAASNILVQFQINDWLTWGALTYPITFLVTDLINRGDGPAAARRVVLTGFLVAIAVNGAIAFQADSLMLARIAGASVTAFLAAQLLDVQLFDRLRAGAWWQAPLASSLIASALDTALFFPLAFYGTDVPWETLLLGDYAVKAGLAFLMLGPFRALAPTALARG